MRLFEITVLFCIAITAARADTIDWVHAEDGVQTDQSIAYSGCAPARSLSDQNARRKALLRAQANMARSKNLMVSGKEQITAGRQGTSQYNVAVSEYAEAFLGQATVIAEEMTKLDGVQQICVLVTEMK